MEGFSIITKNISYIRARDPSIQLHYNVANIRRNLVSQLATVDNSVQSTEEEEEEDVHHYQVYLRIKNNKDNSDLYGVKDSSTLFCNIPDGAQCIRNIRENITKTFKFSKIIEPTCTQTELFNSIVKQKILSFINGFNCTLMSYGASGSGKTFTMVGTTNDPGIIPRSLEYLFRTLPKLPEMPHMKPTISGEVVAMNESACLKDKATRNLILSGHQINMDHLHHVQTYKAMQERLSGEPVGMVDDSLENDVFMTIWVSFAEIYNENIYDLLKPEPCRGQQRQKLRIGTRNGSTFIKGLTAVSVSSGLEAYLILQYGLHNLSYAATALNEHSSRSHCIFTLQLVQASNIKKGIHVSVFNFCDLAGSERSKKTNNAGDRLKESNSINTSLLVLGRCLKLIRDNQKSKDNKMIPFRESKLTQLFQHALLGNEAVSMMVNINPAREMFDETQHTLNFAAIAKNICVEPQKIKTDDKRLSQFMQQDSGFPKDNATRVELENQISLLTDEWHKQKERFKEEKSNFVLYYQRVLAETNKIGEERYHKLKNLLNDILEDEQAEIEKKRSRMSVIVIDSSSDEDEEEEYDEILLSKIADLQTELKEVKAKKDEILLENSELEKIDYKTESLSMKVEIAALKSHLLNINEQIKETKAYVEFKVKSAANEGSDVPSCSSSTIPVDIVHEDVLEEENEFYNEQNNQVETSMEDSALGDDLEFLWSAKV
ncbi:hypothetical protein PPYR_04566 [Photinus pyralis]|uniref:Kinesin-like protein n=2 Tax=Photinus pyralis TaxID=7054 RepID=A0A5N4AYZ5_PHOPY|nr:kinesin-like protein subito [Photinus pyralis]KAB0802380.1 hypothetical protein PPYR_04566 [Photinus pyralis]